MPWLLRADNCGLVPGASHENTAFTVEKVTDRWQDGITKHVRSTIVELAEERKLLLRDL
jgi:hypothetical protein